MNFTKNDLKNNKSIKRNEILYADLHESMKLPIIDVENPAFYLSPDEFKNVEHDVKKPNIIQKIVFKIIGRKSILSKIISSSQNTFVSGIGTYILKIGAENLDEKYFNEIDKAIASSLPCLSARLRLQICSYLIYECIDELLKKDKRNLYLVNIAGGTAFDSINALMIMKRRNPELLSQIKTKILILDIEREGTEFARECIDVLSGKNQIFNDMDIEIEFHKYDWNEINELDSIIDDIKKNNGCAVISSEGGLFEYCNDEIIQGTLKRIDELTDSDVKVIGSIGKELINNIDLTKETGTSVRSRSFERFEKVIENIGWKIDRNEDCPMCNCIIIKKI